MIIAVDFDGTIVEHKYPAIGKEIPFALDTLRALSADGHRLILWTVREGDKLDEAVEYCRERGVEFYAVNSDFPNASWSGSGVSRKVKADVFIDDANIGGLPNWSDIYQMISNNELAPHHESKKHRRPKRKRKGFFRWLSGRCSEARGKFVKY